MPHEEHNVGPNYRDAFSPCGPTRLGTCCWNSAIAQYPSGSWNFYECNCLGIMTKAECCEMVDCIWPYCIDDDGERDFTRGGMWNPGYISGPGDFSGIDCDLLCNCVECLSSGHCRPPMVPDNPDECWVCDTCAHRIGWECVEEGTYTCEHKCTYVGDVNCGKWVPYDDALPPIGSNKWFLRFPFDPDHLSRTCNVELGCCELTEPECDPLNEDIPPCPDGQCCKLYRCTGDCGCTTDIDCPDFCGCTTDADGTGVCNCGPQPECLTDSDCLAGKCCITDSPNEENYCWFCPNDYEWGTCCWDYNCATVDATYCMTDLGGQWLGPDVECDDANCEVPPCFCGSDPDLNCEFVWNPYCDEFDAIFGWCVMGYCCCYGGSCEGPEYPECPAG